MLTSKSIEALDTFVPNTKFSSLWKRSRRDITRYCVQQSHEELQNYLKTAICNRGLLAFVRANRNVSFVSTDELRKLAVASGQAYTYARYIDKGPHPLTREKCMKTCPYLYARYVDKGPSDDSRKAAVEKGDGYRYARYVDQCGREDTRKGQGYHYARDVDKCPHDETRRGACKERRGYAYAKNIDKCGRTDTARTSSDNPTGYSKRFNDSVPTPHTRSAVKRSRYPEMARYITEIEIPHFMNATGSTAATFWQTPLGAMYRKLACKEFNNIINFVTKVEQAPHDITRKATCECMYSAMDYALFEGPHDLTRRSISPENALEYARKVDKGPHPVTFFACLDLWYENHPRRRNDVFKYIREFGQPSEWISNWSNK